MLLLVRAKKSIIFLNFFSYIMEKVDLVIVGAEGVVENGGIINKVRTSILHSPLLQAGRGRWATSWRYRTMLSLIQPHVASGRHHRRELSPSPQRTLQRPNLSHISLIYRNHEKEVYLFSKHVLTGIGFGCWVLWFFLTGHIWHQYSVVLKFLCPLLNMERFHDHLFLVAPGGTHITYSHHVCSSGEWFHAAHFRSPSLLYSCPHTIPFYGWAMSHCAQGAHLFVHRLLSSWVIPTFRLL